MICHSEAPGVFCDTGVRRCGVDICVRNISGKGRGVFAQRPFTTGQVVERCPVIVLPENPWELLNQTSLGDYYLAWGDTIAVGLGFSSLYNHSENPNAYAIRHLDRAEFELVALRDIAQEEEITFCYFCEPWFAVQ